MRVEYEYRFGLPRKIVWKYLKDESILKNSIPGCKSFVETSTGKYDAEINIQAGPIQDLFTLKIRRPKEKSPSFYLLQINGKGELGDVDGTAELHLKSEQGGSTLTCIAEAEVTGTLAVAGQRVLEGRANKSLKSFFQKLEKEIKRSLYASRRSRK